MPTVLRAYYLPRSAQLGMQGDMEIVKLRLERTVPQGAIGNYYPPYMPMDTDAPRELELITRDVDAAQALVVSSQISEVWLFRLSKVPYVAVRAAGTGTGLHGKLIAEVAV